MATHTDTSSSNDENALLPASPTKLAVAPQAQPLPSVQTNQNLTIDTSASSTAGPSRDKAEGESTSNKDVATDLCPVPSAGSSNNFSIDDCHTIGSLSIESYTTEDEKELAGAAAGGAAATAEKSSADQTPKALNQMMAKFDLLQASSIDEPHQDRMMQTFDLLQKSTIQTPRNEDEGDAQGGQAGGDQLFQVLAASESQTAIEVQQGDDEETDGASSHSSREMYSDLERFRSADSHCDHDASNHNQHINVESSDHSSSSSSKLLSAEQQKLLEDRVLQLTDQVSLLESRNDELQSKLRIQHDKDVQDMYQNPYSDPFAASAAPTPSEAAGNSGFGGNAFLEAATRNLNAAASVQVQAPPVIPHVASLGNLSAAASNADTNSDLHRELTELRMQNQGLQNNLKSSERVKERLKKVLATVEEEHRAQTNLLSTRTRELGESRDREASLRTELDACKVRLEGFEIAQRQKERAATSSGGEESSSNGGPAHSGGRSEQPRKSFFSSSSNAAVPGGDLATALVVSQRQIEALQAHNEELESANANLQKKCDGLTTKYGLTEPPAGDAKGTQLYSRYLEMKSSLSSLSVVLEEVQDKNSALNERVEELESELNEKPSPKASAAEARGSCDEELANATTLQPTISAEQEETLKELVEKLEVQILDYRKAEERHGVVKAELESAVEKLEEEASELRSELIEVTSSPSPTDQARSSKDEGLKEELNRCYKELESRITKEKSDELRSELELLRDAMDAAAEESTHLLNEMEQMLASSREELKQERAKYKDLETRYKELLRSTSGALETNQSPQEEDGNAKEALSNSERLLSENSRLNAAILSLQEQTKQLKIDLDKKTMKVEKSEKRLLSKHEKSQQLKEVNASLREGIQQLKGHLATISEEASRTENTLAKTNEELHSEREKAQKLEVTNGSLQTELEVLKASIVQQTNSDEAANSKSMQLSASLAASKKELFLEKELVEKVMQEKREVQSQFDATKEDLQTRLHSEKKNNSRLDSEILSLQQESERLKLFIAVATKRMEKMDHARSTEKARLRNVEKLLIAERGITRRNAVLVDQATESSRQFSELEKLLATTQQELTEEERRVESLEEQVDGLTVQVKDLEKGKDDLQTSLNEAKAELLTVNAKRLEFESLLAATKADLALQIQSVNAEHASSLVKEAEFNANISVKEEEIRELTSKLAAAKSEKQVLASVAFEQDEDKRSGTISNEFDLRSKKIEELSAKLKSVESSQKELLATIEKISAEKEEATDKAKTLTSELNQRIEEIDALNDKLQQIDIFQGKMEIPKTESEGTEKDKRLEVLSTMIVFLKAKNKSLVSELDRKKKEVEDLTDEVQELECSESHHIEKLDEKNGEIEELIAELRKVEVAKERSESQRLELRTLDQEKSGSLSKMIVVLKEEKESLASSLKRKEENIGQAEALAKLLGEENAELRSNIEALKREKDLGPLSSVKKESVEDKASNDVRLWEVEMLLGSTKRELADVIERNELLMGKNKNLESSIEKCQSTNAQTLKESETHASINNENARKIDLLEKEIATLKEEKESLLKRAAALARRDQIQKASLATSNEEIAKLITTMGDFQERFESLAEQVEKGQAEKMEHMKEFEDKEAKWIAEKEDLNQRINALEAENDVTSCPIQACPTDRSIFNNKISELEQELQLLEVTLDSTKQEREDAIVELDDTRAKFVTCEKELEACRDELESMGVRLKTTSSDRDSAVARSEDASTKLESLEVELKTCRGQIRFFTKKIAELESSTSDSQLESLREELEALKNDKEKLEAAASQEVSGHSLEENKKALELITDELNEAHVREGVLDQMLSSCQKELLACKKKIKSFETQVIDEHYGAGVYDELIARLNKSNDEVIARNKKLKQEVELLKATNGSSPSEDCTEAAAEIAEENVALRTENNRCAREKAKLDRELLKCTKERDSLKATAASLQKNVDELKTKIKVARVVSGEANAEANADASEPKEDDVERENTALKELLAASQRSVTEAKTMQQQLSKQIEAASAREARLKKEVLSIKSRNDEMEKRLEDQEKELDEFESDFALARNDARKVVEELRSQLLQLEKRNKQLEADSSVSKTEDLKNKLRQLIQQNKRLQKEIEYIRVRERRLESQLGLEPRKK
ncbi:unnamed protein product [Pseudo-nitzschia multistriata]|uniref:Uncharacterized protein n=1 Tax=Pseudo-nitzschia multistriata TaxID=183589 RepID=A0A448YWD8_9STRA|nr:unnamed protein product [Pseudo-nitzschia multistriata]